VTEKCYHSCVKQLITRLDEDLPERLKARAAAEGRSVNALVTEVLQSSLAEGSSRAAIMARLEASGMRVIPPRPLHVRSRDEVIRSTRGLGTAASEALEADRGAR